MYIYEMQKVLLEILSLALFWSCLQFSCCCLEVKLEKQIRKKQKGQTHNCNKKQFSCTHSYRKAEFSENLHIWRTFRKVFHALKISACWWFAKLQRKATFLKIPSYVWTRPYFLLSYKQKLYFFAFLFLSLSARPAVTSPPPRRRPWSCKLRRRPGNWIWNGGMI